MLKQKFQHSELCGTQVDWTTVPLHAACGKINRQAEKTYRGFGIVVPARQSNATMRASSMPVLNGHVM